MELKVTEFKAEYAGQTIKYMNYIDKHLKKPFHDKTAGIIVCKKNNKYDNIYITNSIYIVRLMSIIFLENLIKCLLELIRELRLWM